MQNNYLNRVPQYIKEYPKFYKFITKMHNYGLSASEQIDNSINIAENKIIAGNLQEIGLNYLNAIANRLNVVLKYLPTDIDSLTADESKELLISAVKGKIFLRGTQSNRQTLLQLLQELYPLSTIEVDETVPMTVNVEIKSYFYESEFALLALYLKPDITGVSESFSFEITDMFTFSELTNTGDTANSDWMETDVTDKNRWMHVDALGNETRGDNGLWKIELA